MLPSEKDKDRVAAFPSKQRASQASDLASDGTTITTTSEKNEMMRSLMSTEATDQMEFYSRVMITLCLVSECLLSFATFSLELFALHGIATFCTSLTCEEVVNRLSQVKFVAALSSIGFGLIFDSYIRRIKYYAFIVYSVVMVIWPVLYFVISYPAHWKSTEDKVIMFLWGSLFHGLVVAFHQIRVAIIMERAIEDRKVPNIRRFVGLLLFGKMFGELLAGVAILISHQSRRLYAGLLSVDILFISLYTIFWGFWSRGFPEHPVTQYACVERAMVSSSCYICKRLDTKCCKGMLFGRRSDWQDYKCFHFSERTAVNTWGFLTMLLVLLPLVGNFVTEAGLNYLYLCQSSNLYTKGTEAFSFSAAKGGYYCLVYPFFEFIIFPHGKKIMRNDIVRMLFSMGIGTFLLGVTVSIGALIQQYSSQVEPETVDILRSKGEGKVSHVVMVNILNIDVQVRGPYLNRLLSRPENVWKTLRPYEPFKVVRVPMTESPFNVSVYSDVFRLYDDYSFSLTESRFNWLVVHPMGMFMLPHGSFHQDIRIGTNPNMFGPAKVNVFCSLPVCDGILEFRRNGRYYIRAFFPDKGELLSLMRFELFGQYEVGFALVGNRSTETVLNIYFERLKVYLLIIEANDVDDQGLSDGKTKIQLIGSSGMTQQAGVWILNVPTFVHALSYIFTQVALLEWMFMVSPRDLRCFIFSIPTLLSAVSYGFFANEGAAFLTSAGAISIFSHACSIWILLIIYGVACLRYVKIWNRRHAPPPIKKHIIHQKREGKEEKRDHSGPGKPAENVDHDQPPQG